LNTYWFRSLVTKDTKSSFSLGFGSQNLIMAANMTVLNGEKDLYLNQPSKD